jgi:hypothetical protein
MPKIAELIKIMNSLSRSEKRYVSVGINKLNDQPKNSSPFDLFRKLIELDIFKIMEKRQGLPEEEQAQFLKEWANRHLSKKLLHTLNILKLQEIIFDLLRQYNSEQPEFKIERFIQDIRILRSKGLLQEALQLVKKARTEVLDIHDLPLKAQELIYLERILKLMTGSVGIESFRVLHQESTHKVEEFKRINELLYDREQIMIKVRNQDEPSFVMQLSAITEEVLEEVEAANKYSFTTQMYSLQNAILYYNYIYEEQEDGEGSNIAFKYRKALYQLFKTHPERQELEPDTYKKVRLFYLHGCYNTGQLMKAKELIIEEEEAIGMEWDNDGKLIQTDKINSEFEFNSLNLVLIFYTQMENEDKMNQIIEQTERWLLASKTRVDNRFALFVSFAITSLLLKQNERTDKYISRVKQLHLVTAKRDYVIVEVVEVLMDYQAHSKQDEELAEKIGALIIQIGEKKNTTTNWIIKKVLFSLYNILNSRLEKAHPDIPQKDSQQIELQELKKLHSELPDSVFHGTGIETLQLWLKRRIKELEALA